MNHQSYSPVVKHFAWLWWSPTASEALSYRLNLYRSMPPDLPRTLCIIRSRKKFGAPRAARPHQPYSISVSRPPPFFNLWVRPCRRYNFVLTKISLGLISARCTELKDRGQVIHLLYRDRVCTEIGSVIRGFTVLSSCALI